MTFVRDAVSVRGSGQYVEKCCAMLFWFYDGSVRRSGCASTIEDDELLKQGVYAIDLGGFLLLQRNNNWLRFIEYWG